MKEELNVSSGPFSRKLPFPLFLQVFLLTLFLSFSFGQFFDTFLSGFDSALIFSRFLCCHSSFVCITCSRIFLLFVPFFGSLPFPLLNSRHVAWGIYLKEFLRYFPGYWCHFVVWTAWLSLFVSLWVSLENFSSSKPVKTGFMAFKTRPRPGYHSKIRTQTDREWPPRTRQVSYLFQTFWSCFIFFNHPNATARTKESKVLGRFLRGCNLRTRVSSSSLPMKWAWDVENISLTEAPRSEF